MKTEAFGEGTMIMLSAGGYTLKIVPEIGGQVIGLEKDGISALHEPSSFEELKVSPTSYGLPVLFPPNRIDGGTFTAGGRTYHFPINEPARGNSLHGFLHKRAWKVEEVTEDEEKAKAVLVFSGDKTTDFYNVFPVTFEVRQTLELTKDGLTQWMAVTNTDEIPLPVGLGFHSAFNVGKGSTIKVSVGERVLMSERMLPEGTRPLSEEEEKLRLAGLDPMAWNMDDHYTAQPIGDFHGAVITNPDAVLTYEVDPFYQHWMIWNNKQNGRFVCIEPQNWRVNAPNLVEKLKEESGMTLLDPMKTVEAFSSLKIERI